MKNVIHTLITKAGYKYTGRILRTQTENAHRINRDMPQDFLLYLFKIEGKKMWLDNYCLTLKCGKGNNWYYEMNDEGERRIKKALGESAKKKT